jgi:hypothetical protein
MEIMECQLQAIRPNRYVWHLSRRYHRNCIAANGLLGCHGKFGLVFANNQGVSLFDMWPLPIDGWDNEFSLYDYDFWRIDTLKAGVNWYVDPCMQEDYKTYRCRSSFDYICTLEDIKTDALKLYFYNEYDLKGYPWYYNETEIIKDENCISELPLYEDVEINNWIATRPWLKKLADRDRS